MKKISAVIITLNEEKKIGQCLDSLKDIADEILVVDSLSTDNTQSICISKGARVVEHPFEGYIAQKNFALKKARYDYVISLDADEMLSDALKQSILQVKKELKYRGYTMNRLTFFEGEPVRHSGWYPDVKLRLFDRRAGAWQGLNPHDAFRFFKNEKTIHLYGDLLHYSFDTEKEYLRQMENFARLSAQAYCKEGKKASVWKGVFNPGIRFVRDYFFNGGILHGAIGLKISRYNAKATKQKYQYLKELYKKHR